MKKLEASSFRKNFYTMLLLGVSFAILMPGCSRRFFRNRADNEVNQILATKDKYPNWNKNELTTRKNLRNIAQKYTAIIHSVKDGISRMTLKADKFPRNRTRKN